MCCWWPIESADGLDQARRLKSVHPCVVEMQRFSYVRGRLSCWSNLLENSGDLGVSPTNEELVIRELQLTMKAVWLFLSRLQISSQGLMRKFATETLFPKTCVHRVLQYQKVNP
jgi:hypothetical protein